MNFFRKMATFVAVILCLSCIKVNIFAATVLKNETVYLPLGAEYAYDTTHLINYDDFDENLSIDEGDLGIKKYGYLDGQWIFTADKVGKEIVEFSYNNFSVMETLTVYIYQPITSININNTTSIVGRDVYVPFSFNENADSTYYNLYASIYTGADNNYKGYEDFSAQSNVKLVRLDDDEIVLCAKKPGQYKIKLSATDTNVVKDPITSVFTLTATKPITDISIEPASINTIMGEYENIQLEAVISPEDTTDDTTIEWESSKYNVATVDKNGLVLINGAGTTTITATTANGGKTAECKINVVAEAPSVTITNNASGIVNEAVTIPFSIMNWYDYNNYDYNFSAKIYDSNKGNPDNGNYINFSEQSNVELVSLDKSNKTMTLKGLKPGQYKIKLASYHSNFPNVAKTVTLNFTVTQPVTGISLNKSSMFLKNNTTYQLQATVQPDNATDKTITWSSSNPNAATVENGLVTAKGIGTTTITATSGEKTAQCSIEVYEPITAVNFTQDKIIFKASEIGTVDDYVVRVNPNAQYYTFNWDSDDSDVADIIGYTNDTVSIKAYKSGETTISLYGINSKTNEETPVSTIKVIVQANQTINCNNSFNVKLENGSFNLNATCLGGALSYSTDDDDILEIDNNGKVTLKNVGTATVTISTAGNDYYNKATKDVKIIVTAENKLNIPNYNFNKVIGASDFYLGITSLAGGQISYTPENSNIVKIDSNGKATILNTGSTTVEVTSIGNDYYTGTVTDYITITVLPLAVDSIAVTTPANKTEFIEGTELDLSGLKITASYNNGTTDEIDVANCSVTGYNKNNIGSQTLTIEYGGKTTNYDIKVIEKSITKIIPVQKYNHITGQVSWGCKTKFIEGEELDLSGLMIFADYNNNTSKQISLDDCVITGYDKNNIGSQTLTIEYGGKTTTFEVTVVAKALDSIAVTTPANKTEFIEGTDLDLSGLKITASYNNGTFDVIDVADCSVMGYDKNNIGSQTLTIEYGGKTTTFEVTVVAKALDSIAVTTPANKTEFIEGTDLDLAGLKITASYNNGTSDVIDVANCSVTGYDKNNIGSQTLTIEYGGKTTTFEVTVIAKALDSIAVTTPANKTEFIEGTDLDLSGLKITASYNNGTSDVIDVTDCSVTGYDKNNIGSQTLTIEYGGKTTTFEVTVVAKALDSIAVTTPANKTEFIEGTELDLIGLKITASYNNGTSDVIDVTDCAVTGYDKNNIGSQTLTIEYGGKSTNYIVTVIKDNTTTETTTETTTDSSPESSTETTTESTTESTTETTTKATTETTTETTTEKLTEVTTKDDITSGGGIDITTETTSEATTESSSETTTEASTEATTESTTETTTETTTKSTTETTSEATTETTSESTTETTSEATTEATSKATTGNGGHSSNNAQKKNDTDKDKNAPNQNQATSNSDEEKTNSSDKDDLNNNKSNSDSSPDTSDTSNKDTSSSSASKEEIKKKLEETKDKLNSSNSNNGSSSNNSSIYSFKDSSDAEWAKGAISSLYKLNIVSGINEEEFAPINSTKRADFVIAVSKMLNLDNNAEAVFSDVNTDSYYSDCINASAKAGIVSGYNDKTFKPENYIKRSEVFVIVAQMLYTPEEIANADISVLNQFEDYALIPDWAVKHTAILVQNGLIKGDGNSINSNNYITRAEMALVLYNIIQNA